MQKKLLIIPFFLLLPIAARAAGVDLTTDLETVGGTGYGVSGTPTDIMEIIGNVINVILGLLGVIFLVLAVYAGFLWMTAGGNEDQLGKAKKILTTSVIGLVIVLAAYSISTFVIQEIGTATDTSS